MDQIKRINFLFVILLCLPVEIWAQDTLKLSRAESEAIFLSENLILLAEKLQISHAQARVHQARLWPNPTLEIDEVNLWATPGQLAVFGDDLQGFRGGEFGKNRQISISLEQLLRTAGKRKKLVALEQVTVDKAEEYFQELLISLKLEFRQQLTQLQFLQFSRDIYRNQLPPIKQLTETFQKQVSRGYVPRGEFVRLKALELSVNKNINQLNKEINEAQKELKLLMGFPSATVLEIEAEGFSRNMQMFHALVLGELIEEALAFHPGLRGTLLDKTYYDRLHDYEKAQRVPDLSIMAGYDRGGNFMYNFLGFGVGLQLPVFNRNQGKIKQAKIGTQQAALRHKQMLLQVENSVALAYSNLSDAIDFRGTIEPDYEGVLEELMAGYARNFLSRDISLIEYLDFFEAYLENKKIILEATKEVNDKAEELNHAIGKDLI